MGKMTHVKEHTQKKLINTKQVKLEKYIKAYNNKNLDFVFHF